MNDWHKGEEEKNEWKWWLFCPHPFVVRCCDCAPTSHVEDHLSTTHTHTFIHVPEWSSALFICFHTNKPSSDSSSTTRYTLPTAEPARLLAVLVWSSFQSAPPQRKRSLTLAAQCLSLPSHQPFSRHETHPGSLICHIGLRWAVWVLVSAEESHQWKQSQSYFLILQGWRCTGKSQLGTGGPEADSCNIIRSNKAEGTLGIFFDSNWSVWSLCLGFFPKVIFQVCYHGLQETCPKNL